MPDDRRLTRTRMRGGVAAVLLIILGLAAVIASALDLSARGLANYVTSDFLTPFFFCQDLLERQYPISGWTLSASPYFIPDHLVLSSLMAVFGRDGFAYALYTPVYFTSLFLLAGCCIRTVIGRTGPALVAGLIFGNVLLGARALPGHAQRLWWLGAPTCHGGLLVLGFAYWWVIASGIRREKIGRLPAAMFALAFVGLLSDSLFLFQIALPTTVALWWMRRAQPFGRRWLRWQIGTGLAALACAQLFKPICVWAGWFYFSRILRVAPTPGNQWHALRQFFADIPILARESWFFVGLMFVAAALIFHLPRPQRPSGDSSPPVDARVRMFFRVCCITSLLIMLPMPVLTCAWKDESNVRYLFNWFVLPGFLLTLEASAAWYTRGPGESGARMRRLGVLTAVAMLILNFAGATRALAGESLAFPYPNEIAALDALLQKRGLKYGLAQYWVAKFSTALSRAGAEVRQIRGNGEPHFWDNNAFTYYQRGLGRNFSWPDYRYVITDRLNESDVAQAFGEPAEKWAAGNCRVWVYSEEGARRIRAALEPRVREKLGERLAPYPIDP